MSTTDGNKGRAGKTRFSEIDWTKVGRELNAFGCAVAASVLSPGECQLLRDLYDQGRGFRSQILMARHGFGRGEYKYFDYPLPPLVSGLREVLYAPLAVLANQWIEATDGRATHFPPDLETFLARCHRAGQTRATPLLLRYTEGDFNCLHQDLYGAHVFPLQAAFLLSRPGEEFEGGEFVLTEQRPRMQSRVEVVPLRQGDCVFFAVNERPIQGKKGVYRVKMRHGVSRLRRGSRHTLGIIFHDAA